MQSSTRRWPSRSRSPLSRNGVGAIGTTPRITCCVTMTVTPICVADPRANRRLQEPSTGALLWPADHEVPGRRGKLEAEFIALHGNVLERPRFDAIGRCLAIAGLE